MRKLRLIWIAPLLVLGGLVVAQEREVCTAPVSEAGGLSPTSLINKSSPTVYRVEDAADSRFYATGEVDFTGALNISMCTKVHEGDGSVKRTELVAKKEFEAILQYFRGRYRRIRVVYTKSDPGDRIQLNDMIDEINFATQRGESLTSSVRETFFAQQAARFGYSQIYTEDPDGSTPGSYETVFAEFRKPRSRP